MWQNPILKNVKAGMLLTDAMPWAPHTYAKRIEENKHMSTEM